MPETLGVTSVEAQARILAFEPALYYDWDLAYDADVHIYNDGPAVFEIKGKGRISPTISARADILRRNGGDIPDIDDPDFESFLDRRLFAKGKLVQYSAFPVQEVQAKGRIFTGRTQTIDARGRVVPCSTISARALIASLVVSTNLTLTFDVQNQTRKSLNVLFYTKGSTGLQTCSAGARITRVSSSRTTVHFIVTSGVGKPKVLSINNPVISANYVRTLAGKAYIVR